MQVRDVLAMSREQATIGDTEHPGLIFDRRQQAPGAGNDQMYRRVPEEYRDHRFEQQVEAFLTLHAADGADDRRSGWNA
jgi:hypothetical protein